jgi:hypothetical protein
MFLFKKKSRVLQEKVDKVFRITCCTRPKRDQGEENSLHLKLQQINRCASEREGEREVER